MSVLINFKWKNYDKFTRSKVFSGLLCTKTLKDRWKVDIETVREFENALNRVYNFIGACFKLILFSWRVKRACILPRIINVLLGSKIEVLVVTVVVHSSFFLKYILVSLFPKTGFWIQNRQRNHNAQTWVICPPRDHPRHVHVYWEIKEKSVTK